MTCSSSSAIQWYSIEPITKTALKEMDFYHLQENEKKILDRYRTKSFHISGSKSK